MPLLATSVQNTVSGSYVHCVHLQFQGIFYAQLGNCKLTLAAAAAAFLLVFIFCSCFPCSIKKHSANLSYMYSNQVTGFATILQLHSTEDEPSN